MGSMSFYWQDSRDPLHELQLVQIKEGRVIKKATWWDEDEETKDIYAARDEKTRGTLLGVSKRGRVACLTNTTTSTSWFGNGHLPAELLPVMFLKGNMSPREFAEELQSNKDLSSGLAFYLVVADIPSKSMYYISKRPQSAEIVETRVVDPGYHHIFHENGLDDSTSPMTKYLQEKCNELLRTHPDNRELLLKEINDKVTKDIDEVTGPESKLLTSAKTNREGDFGSTVVNIRRIPTGKIKIHETFAVNNGFELHEIDFDMV